MPPEPIEKPSHIPRPILPIDQDLARPRSAPDCPPSNLAVRAVPLESSDELTGIDRAFTKNAGQFHFPEAGGFFGISSGSVAIPSDAGESFAFLYGG